MSMNTVFSYFYMNFLFREFNLSFGSRTKAGMTSAAESITESLRRTRQLMVQVSRSTLYFPFILINTSLCDGSMNFFFGGMQHLVFLFICVGGGKNCRHTHDFW